MPRTLSLAEVQVIGDAVDFDVSFGNLFNIPEREINRMVLIQDGDLSSASVFSKITLAQMPAMHISVSRDTFSSYRCNTCVSLKIDTNLNTSLLLDCKMDRRNPQFS